MANIEIVMNLLHMMEGNQWQHVVDRFWSEPDIQATKINRRGDTALHVAVKTSLDDVVARLVGAIRATERVHTLSVMNDTGDTALHAAATRGSRPMCSCIFDCKNSLRNERGETPVFLKVFVKEHERMLERSDKWVKEMSGNYIVAATFISGVTFATSYQIPGGYSSEEGTPVIEPSTPAFRIFSISALVSFCFSITSLATFLCIYSSQIEFMQYRRSLPLKLCLGMSTLFISIFSMVLSFCAAHIFELNPRHKSDCVPFYVVLALLPLGFYTATQLQLSWRLLMICFSTVPLPRPLFYIGAERQPEEKVKEEQNKKNKNKIKQQEEEESEEQDG